MLPVFDISTLGGLLGIGAILKTFLSGFLNLLRWTKDQLITVATASKLWATAAFLAVGLFIFGLFNSLFTRAINFIVSNAVASQLDMAGFEFELAFLNQAIPFNQLFSMIFELTTFVGGVFVIETYVFQIRHAIDKFMILGQSFKN